MKRGVFNGPATIFINEQKVCKTAFQDKIEVIRSYDHPVGRENLISNDRAALNCILVLVSVCSLVMISAMPDLAPVWIIIAILGQAAQLLEVALSQTTQLLWA